MCFSEAGGEFLWQLVIPKLDSGPVNDWKWLGLLSSAAVEGDRVYLVTTRCEVLCLTTDGLAHGNTGPFLDEGRYMAGPGQPPLKTEAHDADIIWKYDMMDELGVFPHNAANCSVLIFGDTLYVCTSNGVDWSHMNVPSPHSPTLIALNKFTGELLGEDNAGIGFRLLHGSWSSPSRGKVGNRDLIFLGGGDGYCYAFDAVPQGGTEGSVLQTIWKADCNPPEYRFQNGSPVRYPEAHGPSEIIGTPVFWNNRVYVAIGQDPEHGQGAGNLVCIDPTGTGDITSTGILWNYQGINRSMSTVSITPEGLLFVADYSGYLHCLDALTGKVHWVHYLKSHIWGSTLVADGKVFLGTEGGDLVVFAASREKALLHTVNLGSAVYTTPVVANGALYIASLRHLFAFTILE